MSDSSGKGEDWCFPFKSLPPVYWDGGRAFGANRPRGRKHGGCDVIKPAGTQIYAVHDGVLVHEETFFYHNTYYVTYQHGTFLCRYGEIQRHSSTRTKRGQTIKRGEPLAKVGLLSGGSHMLHFEMYTNGNNHSTLRTEKGPYMRRADITNPKQYLDDWRARFP